MVRSCGAPPGSVRVTAASKNVGLPAVSNRAVNESSSSVNGTSESGFTAVPDSNVS